MAPATHTKGTPRIQTSSSCIRSSTGQIKPSFITTNVSTFSPAHYLWSRELELLADIYAPSTAGIGTYSVGIASLAHKIFGGWRQKLSQLLDQAIGHTFDQHVIAGYRFIMRFYDEGDKIFVFGFSRGAFTARFLARMIATIGILSKGNEEMVPFAYNAYKEYETGRGARTAEEHQKYMDSFKRTFGRVNAKVHFLGLFDTVNSVGTFEVPFRSPKYLPTVLGTAEHIRHAVSIDERRLKFKPALLNQDQMRNENAEEDIKEVFFAGNHGDVGGGWKAPGDLGGVDESTDSVQASDFALEWMITEILNLKPKDPNAQLTFNQNLDLFLQSFRTKTDAAATAPIHNPLRFGGGLSAIQVMFWNTMGESCPPSLSPAFSSAKSQPTPSNVECIPIFKRKELVHGRWKTVVFPPNMGDTRDMPSAVLHPSVITRMRLIPDYRPRNLGFENALPLKEEDL